MPPTTRTRPRATLLAWAPLWCLLCLPAAAADVVVGSLDFLGQALLERDLQVDGTPVGGLSAITWDADHGRYYVLSDDPDWRSPPRFYSLEIDLGGGRLAEDGARVLSATRLTDLDGRKFPKWFFDGEGLSLTATGTLLASSEGNVGRGIEPSLWEFGLDGRALRRLRLPKRYKPDRAGRRGVRHNTAFEGLVAAADPETFFFAVENALVQDGPAAGLAEATPCRIARADLRSGRPTAEYIYLADPVVAGPEPVDAFATNGVVELLPLGDDRLLVLERSYSSGVGNSIRLYEATLAGATDVRRRKGVAGTDYLPVPKRLLLDLVELGIPLDNLEGMTLGPVLPDGRRSLLLVSDDNFSDHQRTQILAFAVDTRAPVIPAIQGAAHRSPYAGARVYGVEGVVTAVDPGERSPGFWMQVVPGDGDPATSDGLSVVTDQAPGVMTGDRVRVDGRIEERGFRRALDVTRLVADRVVVVAGQQPLPAAIRLGPGGRVPPATLDDDGLESFDPDEDALDFFESLEGMRVEVEDAVVSGATTSYGGIVVLAAGGEGITPRSGRGGALLDTDDGNPERLPLSARLTPDPPQLDVGDRLPGTIEAVVDYDFGAYRLLTTAPLPVAEPHPPTAAATELVSDAESLTLATYNVLNLDPHDSEEKFVRLAETIVGGLGSPDLIALQEIQDDSGPEDDGTVSADKTLTMLTTAIRAAGGPAYAFRQIDPIDNADGGQPGGNIRVAFLFDPTRLDLPDRAAAAAAGLALNPSRFADDDPAFTEDPETGFEAGRKPLVAELVVDGRSLVVINLHLKSKGGDDPLLGARQPPQRPTETQRLAQVRAVGGLVDRLRALDPCAAVVVLGDLNDFDFSPAVRAFADHGLVNLTAAVPAAERYSFNYEGNSQLLDHILVTPPLAAAAEVEIVHLNADVAARRRASDHDPVVARLRLPDRSACE